jgi:cobalt-zinc-cadmium efflux system protein
VSSGHDHHRHPHRAARAHRALWIAFAINLAFLIVEFTGGIMTGSLALLSDAGHMLSDVGALAIALIASRIAGRGPSALRTYGYGRAETLAALCNGLFLWMIVGAVFLEAGKRLLHPRAVEAGPMLVVGAIGLLANIAGALVLFRHREHDLNVRGAFLHLAADSASSVGVVAAGVLMWKYQWYVADPLASFLIGALILISSWSLIKESIHILLEGAPAHIDLAEVRAGLEAIPDVVDCHDLHIWTIRTGEPILTAHLDVGPGADTIKVLRQATGLLLTTYRIHHVTIEVDTESPHGPLH